MRKERVTISVDPEIKAAVDALCSEYSLSRSRVMNDLLGKLVTEETDAKAAVEDAIPDATLRLAELKAQEDAMMDQQTIREKRASFEDRVTGFFADRLEGYHSYRPDEQAELSRGYKRDAEIWHEDEDRIAEKKAFVDKTMEEYRIGYWAREMCESPDSEVNPGDIDEKWYVVGSDLYQLRENLDSVVDQINRVAESRGIGWDHEAVIEAIARKWAACPGAVMLLVQHMVTDDETTMRDALTRGGDLLEDPDAAIRGVEGPDASVPEIGPDDTIRMGGQVIDGEEMR